MREATCAPLYLRLNARMRGPKDAKVGTLRRIFINNLVSYNSSSLQPAILAGIPAAMIEDVNLSNIYFHQIGGAGKAMADLIPDQKIDDYPDPTRKGDMPAHGLFLRNIKGIDISHVEFAVTNPDARPAHWAQNIQGLDIFRLKAPASTGPANISLREVTDFTISGSRGIKDTTIAKTDLQSL